MEVTCPTLESHDVGSSFKHVHSLVSLAGRVKYFMLCLYSQYYFKTAPWTYMDCKNKKEKGIKWKKRCSSRRRRGQSGRRDRPRLTWYVRNDCRSGSCPNLKHTQIPGLRQDNCETLIYSTYSICVSPTESDGNCCMCLSVRSQLLLGSCTAPSDLKRLTETTTEGTFTCRPYSD